MRKYLEFPNSVAPVHDGVYQRHIGGKWRWARWGAGKWFCSNEYSRQGAYRTCFPSAYQPNDDSGIKNSTLTWRGLAAPKENQNAPD